MSLVITYRKLIQKTRLHVYRRLIQSALDNEYRVTSLSNWYRQRDIADKKTLILRHDVDSDTEGAFKMYLIEKELGVKSTYYFRWSTMNEYIMNRIHADGFEVSLHYETLADYCKQHKIFSPDQLTTVDYDKCLQTLKKEIKRFEKRYWKIDSICSHGDKRNRLIKIPNHRILRNISRSDLNILFEAYDEQLLKKFDLYTSDSSIKNNFQWKNGTDPEDAITKGVQTICLLTHPRHWNFSISKKIRSIGIDIRERMS